MAIFRLQENVPDVYPRKSRDFQLLCNAFDAMFNAIKYDIDSITRTADTRLCSDKLLPLLQTKLGFFSNKHFTTQELRTVLQAFKYVVKDKGSRVGILAAIHVFLKVANASNRSKIIVMDNYVGDDGYTTDSIVGNTYIIQVAIEGKQVDTTLLTELLRYVLPAGYKLEYSFYTAMEAVSRVDHRDSIQIAFVNMGDSRGVRVTTANDAENRYPYELTFTTVLSDEDNGESYFFIRNDDTYELLDQIPENWPNGEYYKCVNHETNYVEIDVVRTVQPAFESGKFYWCDPVTKNYVICPDSAEATWGTDNGIEYYYSADPSDVVRFSTTYTAIIPEGAEYLKDGDDYILFKRDGDDYSRVDNLEDGSGYQLFVGTRSCHYERVYLPHNSINGVGTTSTHPATDRLNNRYNYPVSQQYTSGSMIIKEVES